ncbi:MAG TPA: hypothetical protein VMT00_16750 [Thermoanaerobaculia bacterium]|nr:hypothetical protein [Thermoanaerobaculia bacterium]
MRNIAILFFLTTLASAASAASESLVTREFRSSVPRSGTLRLVIDLPPSEVTIGNGPSGTIEAFGTVSRAYGKAADIAVAQQIVDDSSVRIDIQGTRAIIRRHLGPAAQGRRARRTKSDFKVTLLVPEGMHVELRQKAGEVKIAGAFGNILVRMRAGDVSIAVPKRTIKELIASVRVGDVTTNLGDRIISREGFFAGKTHFFNEGGNSILDVRLTAGNVDINLTE